MYVLCDRLSVESEPVRFG
uniref:Uncharacterized protein n=1 Tax=Anguilla anguilla TaxID=7936 RepID=A0A0E9VTB3_ANGAN